MNREKKLIKNTLIITIGTLCTKFITFFMLPLYTYKLTTSEYGTVELLNTVISLIIPLLSLQVDQGIFRFLIDKRNNTKETKKLISTTMIFYLLSHFIFSVVFIIIACFINFQYKWLLLINLLLTSFSSLLMQISRGLGDNKNYSISSVITAAFTIVFNVLFLVGMSLKVDGMLYGAALGYLSGIIYLVIRLKITKYLSIKDFSATDLKNLLKYSLPMMPNSLSWWIFSSSDRVIVTAFLGLSANGILSVAYKFSNLAIIIYNIFNMSLTESISLHINDEDISTFFEKIFNTTGNFFISLCSLLISSLSIAFIVLINADYSSAYNLIPIAIIATIFQVFVGMLGTIYIAKNNTRAIAISSIVSAMVNIITDLMLIKIIGLYAAVVSTVLSYLALLIYRYFEINKKYFKISINKKVYLNFILCILISCSFYYLNNMFLNFINIALTLCLAFILNKDNVSFFIKLIRKKVKR